MYRDHGVIPKSSRDDNFNKPSDDLSTYRYVEPGDLVLNKMKTWQGSLAVSRFAGIVSPAYYVCSLTAEVEPRFIHYLLRSAPYIAMYGARSKGIRPNQWDLPYDEFKTVPVLLPPLDVQRRIADFLDDQVTRIDQVIALRDRAIGLAAERESSAHLHAVRGSDVIGPRADRRLPWLGSLPEAWPVTTVGTQFEVLLGKMLNEERAHGKHLRPYLRNTNVQWNKIDLSDLKLMDFPPGDEARYSVRCGDLLICEGGQPGRAAIYFGAHDGRVVFYQKALHRARSRGNSEPGWLLACLRAAVDMNVFAVAAGQTTIGHLTSEQLRAQRFPFPPPAVQRERWANLKYVIGQTHELVHGLRRQIELTEERKRSLITAAVTGEFDVFTASSRASGVVMDGVGG